ncbi:multicopper oxidase domain-containing protein [Massilia sp. B-10]|nr:multicopper oxidase domain-containing protein [Massilia sp. B-10]
MIGKIIVGGAVAAPVAKGVDISRNPLEVGTPVGARGAKKLKVNLETTEITGQLADGTTYRYWTFNNKVPGPFLRVRVGDEVEVNMANAKDSHMIHSVDFHAVTGPGGGAAVTQAAPGSSKSFTFKALNPGLYVYHCATPDGGPAHLERHVRHDPGRTGRRPAESGPRVLRDARRAVHGAASWHPGRSRILAREAAQ